MFMNSVHEQCPNNDPEQCIVTKLGWVHSVHTQNPGRAHTARAVPMSWALLRAQQACRAHVAHVASAGRAHAGRALVATRPGSLPLGRDLTSMSRHQGSQHHVATSNQCRDTIQTTPCRDINRCHDIVSLPTPLPMSRPRNDVATSSLSATATHVAISISCRDVASS